MPSGVIGLFGRGVRGQFMESRAVAIPTLFAQALSVTLLKAED